MNIWVLMMNIEALDHNLYFFANILYFTEVFLYCGRSHSLRVRGLSSNPFRYAFLRICVPLFGLRIRVSCSDTTSQASSEARLKIAKIPLALDGGGIF
jgi:hypothetical protein